MRAWISVAVLAGLSSFQAEAQTCAVCDLEVSLLPDEASCFLKNRARYLDEARIANPVLIYFGECDEGEPLAGRRTRGEVLLPEPAQEPCSGDACGGVPSFAILSDRLIDCLAERLSEREAAPEGRLTVDLSDCDR